jgi:DNA polymerase-3 subunit delta'
LHSKRIPQALLITGAKGLGKAFLAQQLSQSLVCQRRQENTLACFNCSACQLFEAQTHPDFIVVQPQEQGKAITINQIRALVTQLSLKPQYQQYRVVIINPADQMNHAAANALLKCLEEPPERTVILLITDSISSLAATVISRCQQLLITIPEPALSQQWLQSQKVTNNSDLLVNLAYGAPLLAYHYANEDLLVLRQNCFADWCAVAENKVSPVQIAEQWLKLTTDQLLIWIQSWVMDLIKIKSTKNTSPLSNTDLIKTLQEYAQRLDLEQMYQLYDLLLNSQQRLLTQLNKQLIYEQLLMQWAIVNKIG